MCRAWRVKARKQHRQDTGKKDAVERSGAADRSDGRAEPAYLVEIGQVCTNQRAKAAGDIGQRRAVLCWLGGIR